MSEIWAELGTYLLKYGVFLILAVLGFFCGTKWRKAKDAKTNKMTSSSMEETRQ